MSDIFDHECDAFDQAEAMDWCLDEEAQDWWGANLNGRRSLAQHSDERLALKRRNGVGRDTNLSGEGPCPKCGSIMRLIENSKYGPFHGCTRYPKCNGTRRASAEEIAAVEDKKKFWAERGICDEPQQSASPAVVPYRKRAAAKKEGDMTPAQATRGMARLTAALERLGDRNGTESQLNETAMCLATMWALLTLEQRENFLKDGGVAAVVAKHG